MLEPMIKGQMKPSMPVWGHCDCDGVKLDKPIYGEKSFRKPISLLYRGGNEWQCPTCFSWFHESSLIVPMKTGH